MIWTRTAPTVSEENFSLYYSTARTGYRAVLAIAWATRSCEKVDFDRVCLDSVFYFRSPHMHTELCFGFEV